MWLQLQLLLNTLWSFCISLDTSICLSTISTMYVCVCLCVSVCLFLSSSACLPVSLSLFLFIALNIYLCFPAYIGVSFAVFVSLSLFFSTSFHLFSFFPLTTLTVHPFSLPQPLHYIPYILMQSLRYPHNSTQLSVLAYPRQGRRLVRDFHAISTS